MKWIKKNLIPWIIVAVVALAAIGREAQIYRAVFPPTPAPVVQPEVSYVERVLASPGDGTYIGDIKFGESLPASDGVDIGDVDVATINSVAPQFDSTDRMAVSLYATEGTAGDVAIRAKIPGEDVANDMLSLYTLGMNMGYDGSGWDRLRSDVTGTLRVSLYGKGTSAGDTALDVDASGNAQADIVQIAGVTPQFDSTDRMAVSLYATEGGAGDVTLRAKVPADGLTNAMNSLYALGMNMGYNGSSWDRTRNNTEGTLVSSGGYTETQSTSDQTNYNHKGVFLTIDVTAIAATPLITPAIEAKLCGKYEKVLEADTGISAVGTHSYVVYPAGIAAGDDVVEVSKLALPRTWRVTVSHVDTDTITYTVDYALLP